MGSTNAAMPARWLVVGCGGAGKSTVATRLGERLGLPVIHLDRHYWQAGWVPTERETWRRRVEALIDRDRWVMDGNYGGTMALRLARAEAVVFLDRSRWCCLRRVIRRRLRHGNASRPDVAPGCPDRLTFDFLYWIWRYPVTTRPRVLRLLSSASARIVHLHSDLQVRDFLDQVANGSWTGSAPGA